jgi:hypothetical protein
MPAPIDRKQYRSNHLPAISALGLAGKTTFDVTPKVQGDALAAGDPISVTPGSALPAGLNIAYAIVVAANRVEIGLSSTLALAAGAMPFTVVKFT